MSDQTLSQVEPGGDKPDEPPPILVSGPIAWMRDNLFSSPINVILTFLALYILYLAVPPLLHWIILAATWSFAPDVLSGERVPGASDCAVGGACWIFVRARIAQFTFGFYPEAERWRVILCFFMAFGGIGALLAGPTRYRRQSALFFFVLFPLLSAWLLRGGLGLVPVPTEQWGGFMLTLVIAMVGIVLSLPIGIILALGRRSKLPVIHILCVIIIEFVRGVPLITVLFMANIMLPLFLPGRRCERIVASPGGSNAVRLCLHGGSGARRVASHSQGPD